MVFICQETVYSILDEEKSVFVDAHNRKLQTKSTTRFGYFLKILATRFRTKVTQIIDDLFGY